MADVVFVLDRFLTLLERLDRSRDHDWRAIDDMTELGAAVVDGDVDHANDFWRYFTYLRYTDPAVFDAFTCDRCGRLMVCEHDDDECTLFKTMESWDGATRVGVL